VDDEVLRRLFARCAYPFPEDEMVFFGIRGALPVDLDDWSSSKRKLLRLSTIDYRNMACTIGQWTPESGIAVFPGSTVPNERLIAAAANRVGEGANILARCKVAYTKGVHKQGTPTGHQAFRQDGYFPGTRSRDTIIGDEDDFFDTSGTIFWDNIHAAWSAGPGKLYSSAGCQVVAGFPKCPKRDNQPDIGPWATFRANAYRRSQSRFVYALFNTYDLQKVSGAIPAATGEISLRFGSEGTSVAVLQDKLTRAGFDPGPVNGQFGRRTLQAVLAFQSKSMGPAAADGVVGPQTFAALGVSFVSGGGPIPEADTDFDEDEQSEARGAGVLSDVEGAGPAGPILLRLKQEGKCWLGEIEAERFTIGTATRFTSGGRTRIGLYQSPADIANLTGGRYDPADYRGKFGGLADLICPTAAAESGLMFNRVNTYDRAAFTFGFMQLAAHTPRDNLVLLLKVLLTQKGAENYLPELRLQGGLIRDATGRNLEEPDLSTKELTRLMRFFKPDYNRVTESEASAAGRLMHWTASSAEARDAQVETAVNIFRQRWMYFSRKYDVDLRTLPAKVRAPVFVWAMDIRHQGRGTYASMAAAIKSSNPAASLSAIGADQAGPHRISTVQSRIAALPEIDWSWLL
jgi:peptidoglycan hydrolase-like protein with peptidoglycan-binding domain